MRTRWKVLLTLALVLPLGGFVAGSLASSAAEEPAPRETILISDATPSPHPRQHHNRQHSGDGNEDHGTGVEVVIPSPGELGDDHGGQSGGHGGGQNGGHGGGHDGGSQSGRGHDGGGDDG